MPRTQRPLKLVSARPPFWEYAHQLWERRHFIRMQAYGQAMNQHQGTFLGNAWLIIAPMLDGAVYFFIFGIVFKASKGVPDFIPRLIIGILLYSFVSRCLMACSTSIQSGRGLIRAFAFPRASLPLAAVTKEVYAQVPSFLTMLALVIMFEGFAPVSWYWLLAPLPFLLVSVIVAGIGLIFARLSSWIPDFAKVIPYGLRLLMYASGVIFMIERLTTDPTTLLIIRSNPVYLFIEMTRELVLWQQFPTAFEWFMMLAWAVVAFVFGLVFFWKAEVTYGRQPRN